MGVMGQGQRMGVALLLLLFWDISRALAHSHAHAHPSSDHGTTNQNINEKPLNICILSEPNPITYLSGQSMRLRALFQHLVEHHPRGNPHLITAQCGHERPTNCYDGVIPITYTHGIPMPQYPSLTLSLDVTFQTLRVILRGVGRGEKKHHYNATTTKTNDTTCTTSKNNKFDLIHVTSPGLLLFPALLASRLANLPLVMSYHTHLPVYLESYLPVVIPKLLRKIIIWIVWKCLSLVHSMADLTLVTSPQIRQEFQQHNLSRNKILVWPKGINTTHFHPSFRSKEMRKQMIHGNNSSSADDDYSSVLLLVYIGRLAKEKRLRDLKAILEQLQQQCQHNNNSTRSHLCLIGSGPEEDALREYFQGTDTTFLGQLDGLALQQAFASGDIFVMPSDSETLGFVVLESMASGVPCVAAHSGGLIDIIQDGQTGFLVPAGNVTAFCEKILQLHLNQTLYRHMSLAGRNETQQWSWHSSMEFVRMVAYPLAMDHFSNRWEQRIIRLGQRGLGWARKKGRK